MGILASDSEDKSLHSPRQFLNASRTATPIGGRRFEDTTTIANLHLKSDAHVPPSLSPASEINPIQPPDSFQGCRDICPCLFLFGLMKGKSRSVEMADQPRGTP
ncbi:uncharacterized protein LOC131022768 [Salvia miltiorrhiza]|uniref:uncharacterized protein LOC131022768 n=1 Tax=Salvia miltiorrhiza TaxID=226208 RepID=UPI0025ACB43B|nr:uncharacterized protein LOC131022768 [Salvia miltiorrhiza]